MHFGRESAKTLRYILNNILNNIADEKLLRTYAGIIAVATSKKLV